MSKKIFRDTQLGKLEFLHDAWTNVDSCDEDEPIITIVGPESGPTQELVEKAYQLLQEQDIFIGQAVGVLDEANLPEIGMQNGEIVFDGFTILSEDKFDLELGMSEDDEICIIVHFEDDTPVEYSVVE